MANKLAFIDYTNINTNMFTIVVLGGWSESENSKAR